MSDYSSFIINFYVTGSDNKPNATIAVPATIPSINSITATINDFIQYLQANDINLSNITFVSNNINEIISKLSTASAQIKTIASSLLSSASDKSTLITKLNSLLTEINLSGVDNSLFSPEDDQVIGVPVPVNIGLTRTKRHTPSVKINKFKGLGQKVLALQANTNVTSNFLATMFNKLKPAITTLTNEDNIVIPPGVPARNLRNRNNNIGLFLSNFIPRRPINRSSLPINSTINDFTSLPIPPSPSDITITLPETSSTDYYEISTSIINNLINVIFSYYPAGSNVSSFACTFYLTPLSLISLSNNAYIKLINLSVSQKEEIANNVGVDTSTCPTNQEIWNSYLIWLFSYVSFGVASQLGFDKIIPFSGSTNGSANYLLNREYMENVGNIAILIQLSYMDSSNAGIFSTAVPNNFPSLMYSHSSYGSYNYIANSLRKAMDMQVSTQN